MQYDGTPLWARDDTLLGVCEALGEDFRFNPNWLRAALGVLIFWNPVVVILGYLAVGAVIAASRWLVPNPRSLPAEAAPEAVGSREAEALPLAA